MLRALIEGRKLNDQQMRRYLHQAFEMRLTTKPRWRRGRSVSVDLRRVYDRSIHGSEIQGTYGSGPLTLGAEVLAESMTRDHDTGSVARSSGVSWTANYGQAKLEPLPNGPHTLAGVVTLRMTMIGPIAYGPVDLEWAVQAPVELHDHDALVDRFVANPGRRDAMRGAFQKARVFTNTDGTLSVRLKAEALPMPVSARVLVVRDGAEQEVGSLLITDLARPRWFGTDARGKRPIGGMVDVVLRPHQDPAEYERELRDYWGEDIVISGVVVNEPYRATFVTDEGLREAMEKAVRVKMVRRSTEHQVYLSLNVYRSPAPLGHTLHLVSGDKEEQHPEHWAVPATDGAYGRGISVRVPDPLAKTFDLVARPDPDWERHTFDISKPPWGYEIRIRDIPLPPAGESIELPLE